DFRLVLLRDLDRLAILEDPILEAEGPTRLLAPHAQRELAALFPIVTDPRQARTLLPREGAGELLLEVVEDLFISPGKLRSLQGVCSVDGGRADDIGVTPPRDLRGVVDDLVDLGLERLRGLTLPDFEDPVELPSYLVGNAILATDLFTHLSPQIGNV